MGRVFSMCLEAAVASPFLFLLLELLDKRLFHNRTRTAWYFILAVYFSAVYAVVGLPDAMYVRFAPNCNLVPFAYMFSDYKNSLLNVLLFLPLGVLLPLLWETFRKFHWTFLFGLCFSGTIELLQLFSFRATDVNDLMTNTFGAILGWGMGMLLSKLWFKTIPSGKTRDVYIVAGLSFAFMFFFQPFIIRLVHWILERI